MNAETQSPRILRDCSMIRERIESTQDQIESLEMYCPILPAGRIRAECYAKLGGLREQLRDLLEDLEHCESGLPDVGAQQTSGRVTFLRVHDVGTGFGPSDDSIDAEVIFRLSTESGRAFGFELRDDANLAVRQSMYSLLEKSLLNGLTVTVAYHQKENRFNSIAFRIAVVPRRGPVVFSG